MKAANLLSNKLSCHSISLAVVFLVLVFLVPVYHTVLVADSLWYLETADRLWEGQGYTDIDGKPTLLRAPLFQYVIVLFYHLFGQSVFVAMLALRVLWAIGMFLFYLFVHRLFGTAVALGAFLLAVTSPQTVFPSSTLLLDFPTTIFLFGLLLALTHAIKSRGGILLWGGMGTLMGTAFLFKETLLWFLPLPWLFLIAFRARITAPRKKGVVYTLAAIPPVLPWLVHIGVTNSWNLGPLLGTAPNRILHMLRYSAGGGTSSLTLSVSHFAYAIDTLIFLSLFGAAAWGIYLHTAARRNYPQTHLFILLPALLYLPLIGLFLVAGQWGLHANLHGYARQLTGFTLLTAAVWSYLVYLGLTHLWRRVIPTRTALARYRHLLITGTFLGSILLLALMTSPAPPYHPLTNSMQAWGNLGATEIHSDFVNAANTKKAAAIQEHVPEGSTIMAGKTTSMWIEYYLDNRYTYALYPQYMLASHIPYPRSNQTAFMSNRRSPTWSTEHPIRIIGGRFSRYLSQEQLFHTITEQSVDYIYISSNATSATSAGVLAKRETPLLAYFQQSPSFELSYSFHLPEEQEAISLFKVTESLQLLPDYTPYLSATVRKLVISAYRQERFHNSILADLRETFGWEPQQSYELAQFWKNKASP